MKLKITTVFFAAAFLMGTGFAADPEMRACWITRFEWPDTDETTCKNRISNMMQTLKDSNFNAVLFQIRGEADTLYPNPYEPWGPQFNWTDPGWDPVAFAIQEAHARGIEFHAYINTHTMIQPTPPENTTPQHIYNLYGKPGASPNWQIAGEDGQPAGKVGDYVWLSPGVPDVEAWTRHAILYVVTHYDVDGIHFDRIRTPGPQYSHDPIAQARFEGDGNPDGEGWGDWMRSQITRQLRKIYGAVNYVKPNVKITAAPFGICKKEPSGYQGSGTQSYYQWYQDSFGWMETHVLDAIYPMIYWGIGSAHPFEVLLHDFLNHTGDRHIYAGCSSRNDVIAQVYETRSQGAKGNTVFSYGSVDFAAYKNGPYTEPAPLPEMPWKTHPTVGIIVGYAKDVAGDPVVDAKINRSSDAYNYLSSGDGFYSIIEVPPGTYTVSAAKNGVGAASAVATIAAGQVVQIDLTLRSSKGYVRLEKAIYRIGDSVQTTLTDSDLAGSATATVEAVSSTEGVPERIVLTAEGGAGKFSGAVQLRTGAPVPDGILQVSPNDTIIITYHDAFDGTGPSTATTSATIDAHIVIFDEPLDSDPGWDTGGEWAFGTPTGQAGDHGNPDPTSGHSGSYVYGYNLSGGYAHNMSGAQYLTSEAIDCSGGYSTIASFYRWLNVERSSCDHATFEASNDGATWSVVWENPDSTITDSAWVLQEYDISGIADYRPTVYVRWGMGPTDSGWNYAGWNIDDIQVLQIPSGQAQFIIDNDTPGFTYSGNWRTSSQGQPYGPDKRYNTPGDGSESASWIFNSIPPGNYQLDFWVNDNDYAADAHYYVKYNSAPPEGGLIIASQNWRGDGWHPLGTFAFTGGAAEITLTNFWEGEGIYVIADAMRLTRYSSSITPQLWLFY